MNGAKPMMPYIRLAVGALTPEKPVGQNLRAQN